MNDYLDQVEAQLAELTERGAHQRLRARRPFLDSRPAPGGPRPPRRRASEVIAVAIGAAVVAVVVAILVLNLGTAPRHASAASGSQTATATTTATATHTSATAPVKPTGQGSLPIPANFHPDSFTAISELTWWVLGQAPCSFIGQQSPCGAILRTTDGGRTFSAIEAPRASVANDESSSGYSQIRFADPLNGFAYGPDLYVTHDGGATWHPVDLGGFVTDLASAGGEVYAVVTPPSGTPAEGHLMRSPVGQDKWTAVSGVGEVSGGLWVDGSNVIVQSGGGGYGANVLVSHDGGATFATYRTPSPGLPCQFQGAASPDLWAQCATGTESGVWLSHDGGASFASAEAAGAHLSLPNSAAFGAASGTTAVVGYQQLYRTADGGATWTPVGPSGIAEWVYIAFSDPTHGVALGYLGSIASGNEQLYYTTDGGQTYHLVPLP